MLTGVWVILIFLFAMLPAALSLLQLRWWERRGERDWRLLRGRAYGRAPHRQSSRRFPAVRRLARVQGIRRQETAIPEFRHVNGVGYLIGDLGCEFNARSPYVRCAVNPLGPCKGCRAYQAKSLDTASVSVG